MKTIKLNGKEYPCRITMGAMLRFKRETGIDVGQIDESDVASLITFLWCCIASACAADDVEFGMNLMDFADQLAPDNLTGLFAEQGQEPSGSEKKTGK